MTYWTAILLGLIQGLAEFLPISSSGHLAILQNFLRIGDLENQMLFDVLLHLGTLGAVIFAYHTELRGLCREGLMLLHLQKPKRGARQDPARRRLLLFLIAATLPLIPAAFLSDYLDSLFYDTFFIGFALIATGFLLLAAAALGTLGFFRAFQLWRDGLGQGLPVMELLAAVLCIPSAAALMILGRGHYRGGLPACYPGLTTLPGYAALPWLVGIYQEYSRDPVVLRFADMILAVVCAVLALYFAASFAFRHPRPRLCLFFSLMGIVLNLEALANGQSLFFTALTAAAVLVLLAQSWALLRTCFGPAWPECLLEDRMPSGALERAEGDNAPGGAGVENHHREDD